MKITYLQLILIFAAIYFSAENSTAQVSAITVGDSTVTNNSAISVLSDVEAQIFMNPDTASINYYVIKTGGNLRANFNFENLYYFFNSKAKKPVLTILNNAWKPEKQRNTSRYFGLTLIAQDSMTLENISFSLQAIDAPDLKFDALGYKNKNMNAPDVFQSGISLNQSELKMFSYKVNIKLEAGQNYILRIYPWSELGGMRKNILLDNITIKGFSETKMQLIIKQ